jgi:flagellar biosynthesis/type III secretory pathway protein FliH
MLRLLLSVALLASWGAALAQTPETHLEEAGAAVLAHSTFAHGYRHGYEEGYHAGNTDINMGRPIRVKLSDLHDVKTGYSSQFGPRSVFDKGFHAGLKAGYNDGYLGRSFRAIDNLRAVAESLQSSLPADPSHAVFDQGFLTGYNDGYEHGGSDNSSAAQLDFHYVSCAHPDGQADVAAEGSYCEGYRRGFALGHADGFALRPGSTRMEASK